MKKVIGIFLTMVMVFVLTTEMASANTIAYGISGSEAYYRLRKFAEAQHYDDHLNSNAVDGVLYGCGVVCVEEFETESGMEFSINNMSSYLAEQFDLCESRITKIGEVDGADVYLYEAQSETKVIGTKWENDIKENYYCGSVLFLVYSENDMNGNPVNIAEEVITENVISENTITETTTWENVQTETWD